MATGFLRVLDDHTLGWADFRGNLQYISTGNLAGDDRVAMIVMDYPNRKRLKLYGRARVAYAEEEPELVARLEMPGYDAVVQRAVVVTVEAYDWNCQQHIRPASPSPSWSRRWRGCVSGSVTSRPRTPSSWSGWAEVKSGRAQPTKMQNG